MCAARMKLAPSRRARLLETPDECSARFRAVLRDIKSGLSLTPLTNRAKSDETIRQGPGTTGRENPDGAAGAPRGL